MTDSPFKKALDELPERESSITLSDITTQLGVLDAESTRRLGRIERDLISFEKAARIASPEFSKALDEVIASNKQKHETA